MSRNTTTFILPLLSTRALLLILLRSNQTIRSTNACVTTTVHNTTSKLASTTKGTGMRTTMTVSGGRAACTSIYHDLEYTTPASTVLRVSRYSKDGQYSQKGRGRIPLLAVGCVTGNYGWCGRLERCCRLYIVSDETATVNDIVD